MEQKGVIPHPPPPPASTFLTQKGTLGLKKLTQDEVTAVMPEAHTRSTQATQLVKARKEMSEVQELLLAKQKEFRERMERCKEREEALSLKQEQTREQVAKFAQFMKENDAKRTRALKRAQDEINIRKQKEKEADELSAEILRLETDLAKGKAQLEKQLRYAHYLEAVLEASEEFQEVNDILQRHEALLGTNQDLMRGVQEHNREMEIMRAELASVTKKMQSSILVQNSTIARFQQDLDAARNTTANQEQLLYERENEAKERIRLSGESQMAIQNLFHRTRSTHHSESRPKEENPDVFVALKYIEQRFRDLQSIVQDYSKVQAAEKLREKDKPPAPPKPPSQDDPLKGLFVVQSGGGGLGGGGERKSSPHGSRSSQSDSFRGSTLRASTLSVKTARG